MKQSQTLENFIKVGCLILLKKNTRSISADRCCSTLEDVTKTKECAIYKIYDERGEKDDADIS